MIYLVYGDEEYLIDSYINNEIKKKKIEVVNKYEYPKTSILEFLDDASYSDLFSSKKAIIIDNSEFLNTKDDDIDSLIKYIDNPNEDVYLFIKLTSSKLDERKKIVTTLKEKATVKFFLLYKENDIFKYIKDYFKNNNLTIDPKLINEIIAKVGTDMYMVTSELDKLILYKDDDIITKEDIDNVISVSLEQDIFKLINEITNKNLTKLLTYYNDLVMMGNHPSMILTMISNQFRLIYQVKILSREMMSEGEIASFLGVHPYQVKLSIGRCTSFSENELIRIIHDLAILDEDIKLGRIEINNSLESFFVKLCKN